MPLTGLDILLQLDPRRLERLKRDWHAFTTVTLHDFVFLLSRHAAGVEALSHHPQSLGRRRLRRDALVVDNRVDANEADRCPHRRGVGVAAAAIARAASLRIA